MLTLTARSCHAAITNSLITNHLSIPPSNYLIINILDNILSSKGLRFGLWLGENNKNVIGNMYKLATAIKTIVETRRAASNIVNEYLA